MPRHRLIASPSSGLCWQDPPAGDEMSWWDAIPHCEDGTGDGYTDWALPDIDELISLMRGCVNGTATGDLSHSTCSVEDSGCLENSCNYGTDCDSCDILDGPGGVGCYWDPELSGACSWYWSSSSVVGSTGNVWPVRFAYGYVYYHYDMYHTNHVRCVRRGP
ncbi:MAG: DUF1566 domain-containing protein [Polyangia bacterium]